MPVTKYPSDSPDMSVIGCARLPIYGIGVHVEDSEVSK